MTRLRFILYFILTLSLSMTALLSNRANAAETKTIYLVRHAEKEADGTKNPHLTQLGQKRAQHFALLLAENNITHIYSTDYHRTQETAKPLADKLGVKILSYNPRRLEAFAKELLQQKNNVLVVGHSNTTPQLVSLLGGNPYGEIDESDYNRLYQLTYSHENVDTQLMTIEVADFK
ncbi:histidine phosphatase family protein [Aliikangiella marina]|uniref:Histidine phosphatase family protein n=1 Tax=Aliikangiella marina TaxID=1712262 RepID=A0A545T8R9_9GAMM|nr:phosphoglycerate mutase family protein [Aliikangiella marina]TQV73614.1 histidine phosphatase family protein [Aliikangiella marina]